jgi:hypothetical protein
MRQFGCGHADSGGIRTALPVGMRAPLRRRARVIAAGAAAARACVERLESRQLLATGSITGTAFCDRNGNATFDAGELGITNAINNKPASVTVFLDNNNNGNLDAGESSAFVDSSGSYSFGSLSDGTYFIAEVVPTGYIRTGGTVSATVSGGGAISGKNLGNFPFVFDAGTNPAGINGNGSDQYTVSAIGSAQNPTLQITQQLVGQGSPTVFTIAKSLLGTITINSGAGDDTIVIDYTGAGGSPIPVTGLNIDAGTQSTPSNADRLTVTGTAGPDAILMTGLDVSPGGGSISVKNLEKVTVNGGLGNDVLTMGSGLATDVFFDGGADFDSLIFNGTDNADSLTLQGGAVTTGVKTGLYTNMESLLVNAMGGADNIVVSSTAAGTPTTLNGGTGNDTLEIDTSLASPLLFNGGLDASDHDVLNVLIGTFTFDADAFAGNSNLTVNVASSGSVVFNSTQHLEGLAITNGVATLSAGGNRVLVTRNLSVTGTGKLDLTNNDLILNYSSISPVGTWNGSAYTNVTGLVASGYNGGNWNGNGIQTSSSSSITGLGVAEASQALSISGTQTAVFAGETVDSTAVLIKYTYNGDVNLDGKLNVDDYGRIDLNAPFSGTRFGYYNGDFNYDGKINVDDYGKIDFTIGLQGLPL